VVFILDVKDLVCQGFGLLDAGFRGIKWIRELYHSRYVSRAKCVKDSGGTMFVHEAGIGVMFCMWSIFCICGMHCRCGYVIRGLVCHVVHYGVFPLLGVRWICGMQ
jgi:hypothetical protein